jgi:SAM-dependent methyltransferase
VGRALCAAECLPRKELFESWAVARRVRRRFRGGRVLDLACGHGLLAHLLLLLDDTSPEAVAVDLRPPPSAARVAECLARAWPRLRERVRLVQGAVADVEARPGDLLVSAHACGRLSDEVIDRALAGSARVAVLPCCHDLDEADDGGLRGWMDASLAIDVARAARLRAHGYAVRTERIPPEITRKNRLLLGAPGAGPRVDQRPSTV